MLRCNRSRYIFAIILFLDSPTNQLTSHYLSSTLCKVKVIPKPVQLSSTKQHAFFSTTKNPTLTQDSNGFEHHAEPGSLGSQIVSYTYPRGSLLINPRHFYHNAVLMEWVQRPPHPISLRQLAFFGRNLTKEKLISSALFVREELPTRLAHRIRDMQLLPYSVLSNPHLCKVYEMCYAAFDKFRKVPKIDSLKKNDEFCVLLNELLAEHLSVIPNLVMGAVESSMANSIDSERLDTFMSSVLRSRISRRVIAEQHLALTASLKQEMSHHGYKSHHGHKNHLDSKEPVGSDPNYIGAVFLHCSAEKEILSCGQRATDLVQDLYPDAVMPEIIIESRQDATFPYMRSHLDYVLGELLRNSIEATVKTHFVSKQEFEKTNKKPPPIVVSISSTQESVLIRLSDQGGGIPKEALPYIWSFSVGPKARYQLENFRKIPTYSGLLRDFTTSKERDTPDKMHYTHSKHHKKHLSKTESKTESKNHGYTSEKKDFLSSLSLLNPRPPHLKLGMGLPLSKVYVEYWDGHIDLQSLEGYGCDVVLRISRLGNQSEQLHLDKV